MQFAARDVTERKALQRQFEHLALHDPLTGLANRILFRRELELACARARRQSTHVVVLCLDLDGFKAVNDRFGHLAGDELLVQIAQRLRAHVRETDVLARLGGDEFSLIVADLTGHDQAAQVAARISTLFERPFLLEGHSLTVGCSIGVTSYPDDDSGLEQLMAHADAAMYAAKRSRRHAWRRYRP